MKYTLKKKHLIYIVIILLLFPVVIYLFPLAPLGSDANTQYISATDILKNFKFESIGGEPIVNDGAFNNKLRFDTQASWLLFRDDITPLITIESGGDTYLKYRIVLRNKINMHTNVRINQMAQNLFEVQSSYLGVTYVHKNIHREITGEFQEYITWDHWDFGDIYNWNWDNNYFSGRIVMSFDIDDNPVPDTFGDYADKNFDHIAVSEAGIITNTHGLMSTDMPDIIVLEPSEEESEIKSTATFELGELQDCDNDYAASLDPGIDLDVNPEPIQSFDSSILPDTPGSSMGPTNKDGSPIWDPEAEEKSMTGCNIYYDLNALSPVVYRYTGTLTYTEYDLFTQNEYTENVWDWWETYVREVHFYSWDRVKYADVALHGINRYIQTDMYVAFDIWTSVTLGTLTEYYEQMQLSAPEEYYDALIWSTLAGGWTGSRIQESGDPGWDMLGAFGDFFEGIFGGIFGAFAGIIGPIIFIVIVVVCLYVFIRIGIPLIRRRINRGG